MKGLTYENVSVSERGLKFMLWLLLAQVWSGVVPNIQKHSDSNSWVVSLAVACVVYQ